MIPVSRIVEQIVRSHDFAYYGLQHSLVNLRAVADFIHVDVERLCKKPVQRHTIVMALSRLQKVLQEEPSLLPNIVVENISVKTGLVEYIFQKDKAVYALLKKLYSIIADHNAGYLTVSHGLSEISIILEKKHVEMLEFEAVQPIAVIPDLTGITLHIDSTYTFIHNLFYLLLKQLAPKRINIIEVLTTSREVTFLVEDKYWEEVFSVFQQFLP